MFNNINCVFFSIARPPPEKDIEIAKEVIPNLDELLKDEKNARELVFQLNDAMIETMDENDIPSDFGRECERIMDDINFRYLAK